MHLPNFYYVWRFPGLVSSFFSLAESEISKQARRQVATEELKKDLKTCQAP